MQDLRPAVLPRRAAACPLQVQRLLLGVLEGGHELSEEDMVLLFSGKSA